MAEFSIHNFENLLKELEESATSINTLLQRINIAINNSQNTCTAIHATCLEWRRELEKS